MTNLKNTSIRKPWWVWFLAVDILLLVGSLLLAYTPNEQISNKVVYYSWANLSLYAEGTLAVWWSGFVILLVGLVSYENYSFADDKNRFAWLVLSILFTLLSYDEVGSLHERLLDSGLSMLAIVLVGSLLLLPAFWMLIEDMETRRQGILLFVGSGLMASVAFQEYMEHSISWSASVWPLRMVVEEGSELFGALICLVAAVNCRQKVEWPNQLSRAIPDPLRMYKLLYVVVGALVLHLITLTLLFNSVNTSRLGDPFILLPYSTYVLVAVHTFWGSIGTAISKFRWAFVSLFLISSVISYFLLSSSLGILDDKTRLVIYMLFIMLAMFGATLYYWGVHRKVDAFTLSAFLAGLVLATYCLYEPDQLTYYVVSGILSLIVLAVVTDT